MAWALLGTILIGAMELPAGPTPEPVAFPHFPDRLHAYVWRNWNLVPTERLAEAIGAEPANILEVGKAMGLPDPSPVSVEQWRRSYITIIRRNWHLLPYEQLLALLDWTPEEMAYTLREDDFLYIKLGSLKPNCEPLRYEAPDEATRARRAEIAALARATFPQGVGVSEEPLFGFIAALSKFPDTPAPPVEDSKFSPRFCSSYFTMYGDTLLEKEADSFPEGYLARLSRSGVNGLWIQAVLYKLTPYPWDETLSERYEERLASLRELVARAGKYGIGIHLYLNEPRAMHVSFHERHPGLKGVVEGDHAAMCTSVPAVRDYIRDAVRRICTEVPDLAGFFTISGSENLTNCWSHHRGQDCPRCAERSPGEVIAEYHAVIREGIAQAGAKTGLIAWDWGWNDGWVKDIVDRLPADVTLQSVSEWSIPIRRGGIDSVIGEYSISGVGPGPRATAHWALARERGLKTSAKIQANNTWELSAVPYIPAVENVARHAENIRNAGVDSIMLGWTLGGCPSPNLEIVAEMGRGEARPVDDVLASVAARRHGPDVAPHMVRAWKTFSAAFSEFPFHIGLVYTAPQQMGPANPLWEAPTGYNATMVGLPYDDLDRWRAVYTPEAFIGQFTKVADGIEATLAELRRATAEIETSPEFADALAGELRVMEVCYIHYRSVANQARFVVARRSLEAAEDAGAARAALDEMEALLNSEMDLATRLYALQTRDSRFGYEASNHYYYVPMDLAEKVLNCRDLLDRWLPAERAKRSL